MSNWPGELWRRLQFLAKRRQFERDLDEEMRLHKSCGSRNMGIDQDSAQYKAQRRFGNPSHTELGVRMALGATRVGILAMFMREALVVTGTGGLLGLLVALGVARPLESLLPAGITTSDPASFAWALAVLLGIATVAAVVPALRAIRLDPIRALRYE